jgi:hypothetical protein
MYVQNESASQHLHGCEARKNISFHWLQKFMQREFGRKQKNVFSPNSLSGQRQQRQQDNKHNKWSVSGNSGHLSHLFALLLFFLFVPPSCFRKKSSLGTAIRVTK